MHMHIHICNSYFIKTLLPFCSRLSILVYKLILYSVPIVTGGGLLFKKDFFSDMLKFHIQICCDEGSHNLIQDCLCKSLTHPKHLGFWVVPEGFRSRGLNSHVIELTQARGTGRPEPSRGSVHSNMAASRRSIRAFPVVFFCFCVDSYSKVLNCSYVHIRDKSECPLQVSFFQITHLRLK